MSRHDLLQALQHLGDLYRSGVLSAEEFAHEKADLLAKMRLLPDLPSSPASVLGADPFLTGGKDLLPSSPPSTGYVGEILMGRFRLERLLGQGGMGQVWLAHDLLKDRPYALKRLLPLYAHDPLFHRQFVHELTLTERLQHPGIVRVFDLQEDPGTGGLFYTMEYIAGQTLETAIKEARASRCLPFFAPALVIELLVQVAESLAYAHSQGVIHRDIKPSNLLLTPEGRIKITDFGIAKVLSQTHTTQHTGWRGTVHYTAPEQMRGGVAVTPASDLYSLGVIGYEMLTGDLPLGRWKTPAERLPGIPPSLDAALLRALELSPSDRFPNAEAFRDVLLSAPSALSGSPPLFSASVALMPSASSSPSASSLSSRTPDVSPSGAPSASSRPPASLLDASGLFSMHLSLSDPPCSTSSGSSSCATIPFEGGDVASCIASSDLKTSPSPPRSLRSRKAGDSLALQALPEAALRWCPPGSFRRGSTSEDLEAYDDEKPSHDVTLTRGFWMKEALITQAEWSFVLASAPSFFQDSGPNAPVEQVSWWDVVWFCNALSQKEGLPPAYRFEGIHKTYGEKGFFILDVVWQKESPGYRLPTEAEWEYAARAGTAASRYGEADAIAWYAKNSQGRTHPVAQKEPNPWGLYDTLGNVWEWCFDPYEAKYADRPLRDPLPSHASPFRLLRGGSWYNHRGYLRSSFRDWSDAGKKNNQLGFRVVRFEKA